MCRLFGFRSVINSQVHHSLVHADNALALQSHSHPDGWGVAYYVAGAPHVVKSETKAMSDHLFRKVSGIVSSDTVLAHIRKATLGDLNIFNTHPFQYGPWVFAHNGNIKGFSKHRDSLLRLISPELKRFVLGETDSELLFFTLLSFIAKGADLSNPDLPYADLRDSIKTALEEIEKIIGPCHPTDAGCPTETYLTFLLTNGTMMIAHQGGKALHYSTHKKRCAERGSCSFFTAQCEAPAKSGQVNHLIVSSEPLSGENIWITLQPGKTVGVDQQMNLQLD